MTGATFKNDEDDYDSVNFFLNIKMDISLMETKLYYIPSIFLLFLCSVIMIHIWFTSPCVRSVETQATLVAVFQCL